MTGFGSRFLEDGERRTYGKMDIIEREKTC